MTSTNDGKDLKSNQISGQKGKTYFIELYKSLDSRLNAECPGVDRTRLVCEAWRRVHSLCLQSASSTHLHLLSWLQRHTAYTILQTEWQSPKSKDQHKWLEDAIQVFIGECQEAACKRDGVSHSWETQLLHRAHWFRSVLPNPWEHHVLKALLDSRGPQPSDKEVLEWLKEERSVMFVTRLRQLAASKCDDLALLLATAVMDRVRLSIRIVTDVDQAEETKDKAEAPSTEPTFQNILRKEAGFTPDVWELLTDIEFVLLYKGESRARCIDLAKRTPLRYGYQHVERLHNRLENFPQEKKLWKNAKDVATLIAQVVIARCMVVPQCAGIARNALYGCVHSLVQLLPAEKLPTAAAALAAPAATSRHLHTLAVAVHAQCKEDRKPFVCTLYVRAITAGMNELENLKLDTAKESEARSTEQILASWFIQLGNLLSASSRLSCECILTAFSVHPSSTMYDIVKRAPPLAPLHKPDVQEQAPDTNTEFGSWATDSRTQTNFVKTSETLNLKQTQKQANVLSTAIFAEGEALGLEADLCQDLAVLLSGPRVKTLYWDLDRDVLLENCRTYMERTHGGTRALTTELKYLNLDPNSFQHLPEEEEDENDIYYGIEKGYEHLVEFEEPENIYEDVQSEYSVTSDTATSLIELPMAIPIQRKKKRKPLQLSSEEEIDPLSFVSDTSKDQKERPHSKERSKHKNKERSKSKVNAHHPKDIHADANNGLSEDKAREIQRKSKKKERKERKRKVKLELKIKEQNLQTCSNLSRLVGMKVAEPPNTNETEGRYNTNLKVNNNICITDSDYDSQGKSSITSINSETTENVLFDGIYSMDAIKSPEKTLSENKQSTSFPPFVCTPQSVSSVKEEVTRGIKKLIEYRRHKVLNVIQKDESHENQNTNFNLDRDLSVSKNLPSNLPSPFVRSQDVAVLDTHDTSSKNVKNESSVSCMNSNDDKDSTREKKNIIASLEKIKDRQEIFVCDSSFKKRQPIIMKPAYSSQSQKQYQEFLLQRKCCDYQDHVKSATESPNQLQFHEFLKKQSATQSGNLSARSSNDTCNVQDLTTQQTPHQNNTKITPSQNEFHNFLKELQETINAGATSDTQGSKSLLMPDKTCSKKIIQSRKPDNVPNTFARLSYMHKNKQNDKSKSIYNQAIQTTLQNVTTDKTQHLKSINLEKFSHLQAKGEIVISRVDKTKRKCIDGTAKLPVQNIENLSGSSTSTNIPLHHTKQYPLISNMLSLDKQKTDFTAKNEVKVIKQCNKPNTKLSSSVLTEKDQFDLLLLLRQQSKMNPPKISVKSEFPKKTSDCTMLNNSVTHCINSDKKCLGSQNNLSVLEGSKTKSYPTSVIKGTHNMSLNNGLEPKKNRGKGSTSKQRLKNDDAQQSDWKSVMDDLLAQKTPSRGPNALDITLKKDSFEKRISENLGNQNHRPVITSCKNTNKVGHINNITIQSAVKSNAKACTSSGNSLNSQSSLKTSILKQKHDVAQYDTRSDCVEMLKKSPVQEKHFPSVIQNNNDPFISGIPNSDYDLLEELMDDDLRQEIRELSSDDEAYRTPNLCTSKMKNNHHSKESNPLINKTYSTVTGNPFNIDVITNPDSMKDLYRTNYSILNKDLFKKSNSLKKPVIRKKSFSKDNLHPLVSNTETQSTTQKFPATEKICNKVSGIIQEAMNSNNSSLNAESASHMKNKLISSTPNTKIPISNNISKNKPTLPKSVDNSKVPSKGDIHAAHKSQIVLDHPQIMFTKTAQNVMLIGTDVIYDPFSSMQMNKSETSSSISDLSKNTYIAVNQAPMNLTMLHSTPFTAPVLNPVIIDSSVTLPVIQKVSPNVPRNVSLNSDKLGLSTVCNGFKNINKLKTESIQPTNEVFEKKYHPNKDDENVNNVSLNDISASTPISTNNRVISGVRQSNSKEDNIVTEGSGSPQYINSCIEQSFSETIENPDLHTNSIRKGSQEQNFPDCKINKSIDKMSFVDTKTDALVEKDRIQKKRVLLLNRKISNRCYEKPIPLPYASINTSKKHTKKQDTLLKNTGEEKNKRKTRAKRNISETTDSTLKYVLLEDKLVCKKRTHRLKKGGCNKIDCPPDLKQTPTVVNEPKGNNKKEVEINQMFEEIKYFIEDKNIPNLYLSNSIKINISENQSTVKSNGECAKQNILITKTEDMEMIHCSHNTHLDQEKQNAIISKHNEKKTDHNILSNSIELKNIDEVNTKCQNFLMNDNIHTENSRTAKPSCSIISNENGKEASLSSVKDINNENTKCTSQQLKGLQNMNSIQLTPQKQKKNRAVIVKKGKISKTIPNTEGKLVDVEEETNPITIKSTTKESSNLCKNDMIAVVRENGTSDEQISPTIDAKEYDLHNELTKKQKSTVVNELQDVIESVNGDINTRINREEIICSSNTTNTIQRGNQNQIKIMNELCNKDNTQNLKNGSRKLKNTNSFEDKIVVDDLPNAANGPLKKCVRITLPNGNTFKATISGKLNVNVNSIFDEPTVKSLLWKNINNNVKCTLNIKQVSVQHKKDLSILRTEVKDIFYPQLPTQCSETINLISDDEDDFQSLKTEFGTFIIRSMDSSIYKKHQKKLSQKTVVTLERCDIMEEIDPVIQANKKSSPKDVFLSAPQEKLTDYVEIDDSSNDSTDITSSFVKNTNTNNKLHFSREKFDDLKSLLLKDLGVEDRDSQLEETNSLANVINKNIEQIMPPVRPNEKKSKKILLKIKKCDDLVEKLKIKNQKCFVSLIRCDATVQGFKRKNDLRPENNIIDELLDDNMQCYQKSAMMTEATLQGSNSVSILNEVSLDNNVDIKSPQEKISASVSPSLIDKFEIPLKIHENPIDTNLRVELVNKECNADWLMTKSLLNKFNKILCYLPRISSKKLKEYKKCKGCLSDSGSDISLRGRKKIHKENIHGNKVYQVPSLLKLIVNLFACSDALDSIIKNNTTSFSTLKRKSTDTVELCQQYKISKIDNSTHFGSDHVYYTKENNENIDVDKINLFNRAKDILRLNSEMEGTKNHITNIKCNSPSDLKEALPNENVLKQQQVACYLDIQEKRLQEDSEIVDNVMCDDKINNKPFVQSSSTILPKPDLDESNLKQMSSISNNEIKSAFQVVCEENDREDKKDKDDDGSNLEPITKVELVTLSKINLLRRDFHTNDLSLLPNKCDSPNGFEENIYLDENKMHFVNDKSYSKLLTKSTEWKSNLMTNSQSEETSLKDITVKSTCDIKENNSITDMESEEYDCGKKNLGKRILSEVVQSLEIKVTCPLNESEDLVAIDLNTETSCPGVNGEKVSAPCTTVDLKSVGNAIKVSKTIPEVETIMKEKYVPSDYSKELHCSESVVDRRTLSADILPTVPIIQSHTHPDLRNQNMLIQKIGTICNIDIQSSRKDPEVTLKVPLLKKSNLHSDSRDVDGFNDDLVVTTQSKDTEHYFFDAMETKQQSEAKNDNKSQNYPILENGQIGTSFSNCETTISVNDFDESKMKYINKHFLEDNNYRKSKFTPEQLSLPQNELSCDVNKCDLSKEEEHRLVDDSEIEKQEIYTCNDKNNLEMLKSEEKQKIYLQTNSQYKIETSTPHHVNESEYGMIIDSAIETNKKTWTDKINIDTIASEQSITFKSNSNLDTLACLTEVPKNIDNEMINNHSCGAKELRVYSESRALLPQNTKLSENKSHLHATFCEPECDLTVNNDSNNLETTTIIPHKLENEKLSQRQITTCSSKDSTNTEYDSDIMVHDACILDSEKKNYSETCSLPKSNLIVDDMVKERHEADNQHRFYFKESKQDSINIFEKDDTDSCIAGNQITTKTKLYKEIENSLEVDVHITEKDKCLDVVIDTFSQHSSKTPNLGKFLEETSSIVPNDKITRENLNNVNENNCETWSSLSQPARLLQTNLNSDERVHIKKQSTRDNVCILEKRQDTELEVIKEKRNNTCVEVVRNSFSTNRKYDFQINVQIENTATSCNDVKEQYDMSMNNEANENSSCDKVGIPNLDYGENDLMTYKNAEIENVCLPINNQNITNESLEHQAGNRLQFNKEHGNHIILNKKFQASIGTNENQTSINNEKLNKCFIENFNSTTTETPLKDTKNESNQTISPKEGFNDFYSEKNDLNVCKTVLSINNVAKLQEPNLSCKLPSNTNCQIIDTEKFEIDNNEFVLDNNIINNEVNDYTTSNTNTKCENNDAPVTVTDIVLKKEKTVEHVLRSINGKFNVNQAINKPLECPDVNNGVSVLRTSIKVLSNSENSKKINSCTDNDNKLQKNVTLVYNGESSVILKGSIYEDPIVGTCYVFPVTNRASITSETNCSNICDNVTIDVLEALKSKVFEERNKHISLEDCYDIENLTVVLPKLTYARQRFKNDIFKIDDKTYRKNLKRKLIGYDSKLHAKRYRKGKNIDYPKFTVTTMLESAYSKEYKRLLDYCSSIKFSYSRPFHKEYIDVIDILKGWPIKETEMKEPNNTVFENILFSEEHFENKILFDPLEQTLAEEISQFNEHQYVSEHIDENNFNMGFGEESDRVIQTSENINNISQVSAATLSDVKQSQPFLTSMDYGHCRRNHTQCKTNQHQIEIINRSFSYIQLRDKVRSFFKKTAAELNCDWVMGNMKTEYKKSFNNLHIKNNFPYDLINSDFIEPAPVEAVVQVVQVGQLPVSAAAQNPVTCDPRVTQVTDASPQCSVENSPHDDSQSPIKTEYTELTTADLSLPLVQSYDRHIESQESSKVPNNHHEDIPVETEITSIVKTEITVELSPLKEEPIDYSENDDLQSLVNKHINNVEYSFDSNENSIIETQSSTEIAYESLENQETDFAPQQKQQNGSAEKTDQIAHAMNAAGITTTPETIINTRGHALVNILSQKVCQEGSTATTQSGNNYSKTPINAMTLQQALAQILPTPLNQSNNVHENNQTTTNSAVTSQVLHIVQGKNTNGNQITLVENSQNPAITNSNTPVLHIVQNKGANANSNTNSGQHTNSYSGLSLVDTGQGSNQLLHIVNTGNQKNNSSGQVIKRVNLLTNLTNVQGSNEQKMVQFVCKSADGKSIHLNAPHQRSMVLRLHPIDSSSIQTNPKIADGQDSANTSPTSNTHNIPPNKESTNAQHEIKSRSIYEENYAKFIQNSSNKSIEKATSLPKFNQAFGKQVFQDSNQKGNDVNANNSNLSSINSNSESSECQSNDNSVNLDHIQQINSPPLLLRKSSSQPNQIHSSQPNLVQQIKQTIAPMNIQTMHGGVIYTRQIPVNIGGGQTINLITVPSTELIEDCNQKQKGDVKFINQNELDSPIIKIVPQNQSTNVEGASEDGNNRTGLSNENVQNTTTQNQPVLTQMRIKLPMLSKTPQMMSGARVVRPSFFQIQRNVIGGANQHVYQQLVLTAAPPLGQHTIRLPQTQTGRQITKTPAEGQSSSEPHMSSSTLEQLREFDMVLEQVKERSTVQPNPNSSNTFTKLLTSTDSADATPVTSTVTESTQQVLYSIGANQSLNVAYINRKTIATTPTTSTFVRSPDSTGVIDSPSSSAHIQIPHTVTSESTINEATAQPNQPKPAKVGSKSKSRPKSSSNPPSSLKINSLPPKPSTQKPLEDEQTTQRILYILAEYKEQVENSPDKDKPAPRRRSNPPTNPSGSSKRKKSSSSSRRPGVREMSPVHGDDTCRTMGSEDSSCGTSQGDCNESCLDSHSPQDSPRKVVRKLTFENETPTVTQPRPQPQRNVIVADGQTITVARGTAGKPATAVLMPANYILPVSMVKGGQQIAIVTNRGPKLLTVGGGEGGATNALLLQRLIGPAGLKPVLTRPGVRHVRLPTAALHNLHAFNLTTATTVQPPDSTASPAPAPTPELVETRANSSPWRDRESQDVKPERDSSPEGSEPWNLPSSADPHDYTYEETVRTDNMDRTVLEAIPGRYSPDMEAQRIFDKMFDVDSKKSYIVDSHDDSSRCAYDIDASDCDDKVYHQVVHKKDASQRHHRLTHVSAAALRHKYAILEHELRLQKSLSEECEDLGVDSPSASELFPEAELLFAASPAHDAQQHSHTPQPTILNQSGIPQPDIDDQIATDELLQQDTHEDRQELDVTTLGLDEGIVTVSEDGMQATIALDQEEFARSHPNTTFHSSEPTDEGEIQPFTISGLKGRHITSTIFHAGRAPATVLVTAPQTTVISQPNPDNPMQNNVKYANINQIINSSAGAHGNLNLSSVLVKDDGLTKFDNILTDSRELHLSNTASAIVHSTGNATQVIRRVCYEDDKRDTRFLMDESDGLIAGDDAKMIAEDSSRDATLESMAGDVDDDNSSPERHAELFWESNSASERSESRRPMDFSSDSEKCCKSPSFDETNSTDSSGVGTHMRLDSVIKDARGMERSGSADGSSADDTHPPLRTYPAKRMYHVLDGDMERSMTGKTRAGERSPDSLEVRRRASGRGVVKRGCHCCTGSPAPPRPKKSRQRKPTMDFTN